MKHAIVFVLIALAGCAKAPEATEFGTEISDGNGSALVQEVTLKDGTRCAVLIGYYKGGITCDWRKP